MSPPRLILASRSPRRIELMRHAGFDFGIEPADIDEESFPPGLSPSQIAEHLAREKALLLANSHPQALVIGADTVVAIGPTLYGKAVDADDARRMLRQMSGTIQQVITGVALCCVARSIDLARHALSNVAMARLTDAQIDAYIASDQWRGKAGAYGIQDDDPLVRILDGSYSNVVGLPMELLAAMLHQVGVDPRR